MDKVAETAVNFRFILGSIIVTLLLFALGSLEHNLCVPRIQELSAEFGSYNQVQECFNPFL